MWWVETLCLFESIFTYLTRGRLVGITELSMEPTLTIGAT